MTTRNTPGGYWDKLNKKPKTIAVPADFFEHLLNCLANQKYIGEAPINGDALAAGKETRDELRECNQKAIDDAYDIGRTMLSKYELEVARSSPSSSRNEKDSDMVNTGSDVRVYHAEPGGASDRRLESCPICNEGTLSVRVHMERSHSAIEAYKDAARIVRSWMAFNTGDPWTVNPKAYDEICARAGIAQHNPLYPPNELR